MADVAGGEVVVRPAIGCKHVGRQRHLAICWQRAAQQDEHKDRPRLWHAAIMRATYWLPQAAAVGAVASFASAVLRVVLRVGSAVRTTLATPGTVETVRTADPTSRGGDR